MFRATNRLNQRQHMAQISYALLQAHASGAPISEIAERIGLPEHWVDERIEAARLSLWILQAR